MWPAARCRPGSTACSRTGVITGYGPDVDPVALDYVVTAFVTLEIPQAGGHDPVAARLAGIPEVLEVHTITGAGDLLCRVVARTNADLQRVIDAIVSLAGVVRASTVIALATPLPYLGPPAGPRQTAQPPHRPAPPHGPAPPHDRPSARAQHCRAAHDRRVAHPADQRTTSRARLISRRSTHPARSGIRYAAGGFTQF